MKLFQQIILAAALIAAASCAIGCGESGGDAGGGGTSGGGSQPLSIATTGPLPRAVVGQPYNFTLQAAGGATPYTWSIPPLTGPFPDGLSLSATGVITGTPILTSNCSDIQPEFQVQDSKGAIATQRIEILCLAPVAFTSGTGFGTGNVGLPYSGGVNATGGVKPYSFSLVGSTGPLPAGLSFSNQPGAGIIQGTPTKSGSVTVTIQVADSGTPQFTAMQAFDLTITNNIVVAPSGMPIGVLNVPYSEAVQVFGGTPPYHWAAADQFQKLPAGLNLDPAIGNIYGMPMATGVSGYIVQVTDSTTPTPVSMNQSLQFIINPPLKLDTPSAHDGTIGRGYSINFQMEGGRPPYSATLLSGSLPANVTIQPSNNNSINAQGTPTQDGLSQFTLKFADSYETPNILTQNYQIRISDPLAITLAGPGPVIEGQSYTGAFSAAGGFPPYSWSAGSVPSGLSFDTATGVVTGVAGSQPRGTIESSETMFVTLQDSSNPPFTTTGVWGLEVFAKLRIETSFFPAIATGNNVWLTPVYDGGVYPLTWSITSGSLPPGTTIRAKDGTISGEPSNAGSYPITLTLADSNTPPLNQTVSKPLMLIVKDPSQLNRNDTTAQATPISNGYIVASISPFSGPGADGPDIDVYSLSATPGALVDLVVGTGVSAVQPTLANSLLPVLEVVDVNGVRYQTCSKPGQTLDSGPFDLACINGLDGNFSSETSYTFKVPGVGTSPVTFYVRISDGRGDARPDFVYTLVVSGTN